MPFIFGKSCYSFWSEDFVFFLTNMLWLGKSLSCYNFVAFGFQLNLKWRQGGWKCNEANVCLARWVLQLTQNTKLLIQGVSSYQGNKDETSAEENYHSLEQCQNQCSLSEEDVWWPLRPPHVHWVASIKVSAETGNIEMKSDGFFHH